MLFKSASSNPDSEVGYELANIDSTAVAAPAIDVVFVDSASVSQISEALRDVGVEIVSGPSHLGVYRVRLGPAQTDDGVASAPDAAAHLKANVTPIVIFAEPVP
ncbi:MAG TPA: hypothetical protein EYQ02_05845 [Microbacterium sp.]|nr:hypothetical protein [Microbacterium sp.]